MRGYNEIKIVERHEIRLKRHLSIKPFEDHHYISINGGSVLIFEKKNWESEGVTLNIKPITLLNPFRKNAVPHSTIKNRTISGKVSFR